MAVLSAAIAGQASAAKMMPATRLRDAVFAKRDIASSMAECAYAEQ
jgi:hypothetical protein